VALACGPRARGAATDTNGSAAPPHASAPAPVASKTETSAPLASSLKVRVDSGVRVSLHVTNNTKEKIELRFPSGRTHDFVVLDEAGTEVWRWSSHRMFTQAMQTKMLDPDETVNYEQEWQPHGARGKFVAVAKLNSSNFPIEQRVEFTLP
jgi:hypothetical protein